MLDEWFVRKVQPALDVRAARVRFADDFAVIFEHRRDAERFLAILPERFGGYA